MKTYIVFEPPGGARTLEAAERVVFLREKFSWPALLFTPIWLLWSRLWLAFLGWAVLTVAIAVGMTALGLKDYAGFCAAAIPSLIAYRFLRGRVDGLVIQIEKEAIRFIEALLQHQRAGVFGVSDEAAKHPLKRRA